MNCVNKSFSIFYSFKMKAPVSLLKRDLSEVSTIKKNSPYKVYV